MRLRSWMMLGIGYLAGTRAGREKFEQMRLTMRDMASSDATNDLVNKVRSALGMPASEGFGGDGAGSTGPEGWQHEEGAWVPEGRQGEHGESDLAVDQESEASRRAESTTGS